MGNIYRIQTTNKIDVQCESNTPAGAISKVFGNCDIKPAEKGQKGVNVCVTLMNGKRTSQSYYIVQQHTSELDLPQMTVYNIKWDVDDDFEGRPLPKVIKVPTNRVFEDLEAVSDYITEEVTHFCHNGFDLKCSMSIPTMQKKLAKLQAMLKDSAAVKRYSRQDLKLFISVYIATINVMKEYEE